MNKVWETGRLTMEPNVRYSSVKMQMARQKSELWQAIILQLQGAIISRQQIFFAV